MSDALARTGEEDDNGGERKDYGSKRQRLEGSSSSSSSAFGSTSLYDGAVTTSASPSSSSLPSSSTSPSTSGPPVASIASFVDSLQDDEATIPDEVISSILRTTGCDVTDTRLYSAQQHPTRTTAELRLIALSAQRFLFSVAEDAQQVSRIRRSQHGSSSRQAQTAEQIDDNNNSKSSELTMEDLSVALSYAGITVSKPPYYADHVDPSER